MTSSYPANEPLVAKFLATIPHNRQDEFAGILRMTEGKLKTQFFEPEIDVKEDGSRRLANTPEDVSARINISVGSLRDGVYADERLGFFNRAMSAFEYELSHHGFELSRIKPKILDR